MQYVFIIFTKLIFLKDEHGNHLHDMNIIFKPRMSKVAPMVSFKPTILHNTPKTLWTSLNREKNILYNVKRTGTLYRESSVKYPRLEKILLILSLVKEKAMITTQVLEHPISSLAKLETPLLSPAASCSYTCLKLPEHCAVCSFLDPALRESSSSSAGWLMQRFFKEKGEAEQGNKNHGTRTWRVHQPNGHGHGCGQEAAALQEFLLI